MSGILCMMARAIVLSVMLVGLAGCAREEGGGDEAVPCGQLGVWMERGEMIIPPGDLDEANEFLKNDMTEARLNLIARALEGFCTAQARYPVDLEELLEWARGGDEACAFSADYLVDAWGREIQYQLISGLPRVTSAGRDGQELSSDDLRVPHPTTPDARVIPQSYQCVGREG